MKRLLTTFHYVKRVITLGLVVMASFSCDVIPPEDRLIPMDIPTPAKKVLLEEFTGMKCPNCPDAANTIDSLKKTWGDNLVTVSFHSGVYAKPSGIFTMDFRTEAGNAYEAEFGIDAYPVGLVDRSFYNNKLKLSSCEWSGAVIQRAVMSSPLGIEINNQWLAGERKLKVKVDLAVYETVSDPLRLQVWLVEDSIVAPQVKGSDVIMDYVHMHVFRSALNGTRGEELKGVVKNAILGKNFEYLLPEAFNPGLCKVVAFIYRSGDKSVVQVNTQALTE